MLKSSYSLKSFKNSKDSDLIKALKIYSDNIEPAYRTDTREILYWIENYNKKFEDIFVLLGLYKDDTVIGFAELAAFKNEKIVIVDYLVIDRPFRGNNTFFEFIEKIKDFLSLKSITFDYLVGEVGCFFETAAPPESSRQLIRLLKMADMGVVKTIYYVPRLGLTNYESEVKAFLMLYSNTDVKVIKKNTYLQIVKTIYYKYYQRWYNQFFNKLQQVEYEKVLNKQYSKIEKYLEKIDSIEINGYNNLFQPINDAGGKYKSRKALKVLTISLLFIICTAGIGTLGLFIQSRLGVTIDSQFSIITISAVVVTFVTSVFFEKKSKVFSEILEKLINKI